MSKKSASDGPAASPPELRVYRLDGGSWTWCYVEPATEIELQSNTTYGSRDEAATGALRAYPDLPVAGGDDEAAD